MANQSQQNQGQNRSAPLYGTAIVDPDSFKTDLLSQAFFNIKREVRVQGVETEELSFGHIDKRIGCKCYILIGDRPTIETKLIHANERTQGVQFFEPNLRASPYFYLFRDKNGFIFIAKKSEFKNHEDEVYSPEAFQALFLKNKNLKFAIHVDEEPAYEITTKVIAGSALMQDRILFGDENVLLIPEKPKLILLSNTDAGGRSTNYDIKLSPFPGNIFIEGINRDKLVDRSRRKFEYHFLTISLNHYDKKTDITPAFFTSYMDGSHANVKLLIQAQRLSRLNQLYLDFDEV